jgi:hypothetical protein
LLARVPATRFALLYWGGAVLRDWHLVALKNPYQ